MGAPLSLIPKRGAVMHLVVGNGRKNHLWFYILLEPPQLGKGWCGLYMFPWTSGRFFPSIRKLHARRLGTLMRGGDLKN